MAKLNSTSQVAGKADMSAKPEKTSYAPKKAQPPTPMTDTVELSNVGPLEKTYPTKKQMKYGGSVIYNNGPRKIRR